jgi:putative DNA primase/helicase
VTASSRHEVTPSRDLATLAHALCGIVVGPNAILAPGPGHSLRDRSLSVKIDVNAPCGFQVHSFSGDDWRGCRDHVLHALGITASSPRPSLKNQSSAPRTNNLSERIASALRLWRESAPLPGTLGMVYFVVHRRLAIDELGDVSHVLRWHGAQRCVVALMTSPNAAEPCGVHRTFLNSDGTKRDRKMWGKQGVVCLSPNDAVTAGLGISEGIEDGLAVLLSGWGPVWAATSAGAVERFPILSGIEALTVFADADTAGMKAATACVARWRKNGRNAVITSPHL